MAYPTALHPVRATLAVPECVADRMTRTNGKPRADVWDRRVTDSRPHRATPGEKARAVTLYAQHGMSVRKGAEELGRCYRWHLRREATGLFRLA